MKKKYLGGALCLASLVFCAVSLFAQVSRSASDLRPTGKGWGVPDEQSAPSIAEESSSEESISDQSIGLAAPAAPTGNGINYHGGPVMLGQIGIYYIWYGNWQGNTATTILTDLAHHIGGSAYFNINTTYFNASGQHVSNSVAFRGS